MAGSDLAGVPGRRRSQGAERFRRGAPAGPDDPAQTLALLDEFGSPATTATNGPRYFGLVIGATLPAAAAAERLAERGLVILIRVVLNQVLATLPWAASGDEIAAFLGRVQDGGKIWFGGSR